MEIDSGETLVGNGAALDSVALLEFVIGIENEFSILLDDVSLTLAHFESLGTLAEMIQSKIKQQPQS